MWANSRWETLTELIIDIGMMMGRNNASIRNELHQANVKNLKADFDFESLGQ